MGYRTSKVGLRTVALAEGAKGILVLAVGLGLLSLIHHDVQHLAEQSVRLFHLNPASHYPRIFIQAAAHLDNRRLWLLAMGALAYAALRLVEAYGLWHARRWAEWFAIITAGIYLPIEVYELFLGVTTLKVVLLAVNILIVGYLAFSLRRPPPPEPGTMKSG